jgi:Restriction Enzyme Adenine Methylase Associated
MALVEWADNIAISDDAPEMYWPAQLTAKNLPAEMLARQRYWHALPDGWENMDYAGFLAARRKLMGHVVRDAYARLREHGYTPVYPEAGQPPGGSAEAARSWTHHGVHLTDLISADLLPAGTTLLPAQRGLEAVGTVLPDGEIAYADDIYSTPSAASGAASGTATNGWMFWAADTPEGRFTLAALREEFLARQQ